MFALHFSIYSSFLSIKRWQKQHTERNGWRAEKQKKKMVWQSQQQHVEWTSIDIFRLLTIIALLPVILCCNWISSAIDKNSRNQIKLTNERTERAWHLSRFDLVVVAWSNAMLSILRVNYGWKCAALGNRKKTRKWKKRQGNFDICYISAHDVRYKKYSVQLQENTEKYYSRNDIFDVSFENEIRTWEQIQRAMGLM